jgi:hypothetical protein
VSICLDGELWARHDVLREELDQLSQESRGKMGDSAEAAAKAKELRAVEEAMKASEETVEFRGIPSYQLAEIQARFPAKDNRQGWDINAGAAALVAACAVEPTTEAEAEAFLKQAHMGITDKLVGTAWMATTGSSEVPFSARASVLIKGSGSK